MLPLVSKAFQEAANEAHGLWARVQLSMLTLMAGRMPCLVRWLGMHAPAIRVLVLYGRPLPSVEVALREHVDLVAAVVQQMTGLQQLDLARPLGAAVLARLEPRRLACLRSVGVDLAGGGGSRGGGAGGGYAARRKRASEAGEVERATANLLALPALSELLVQSCLEVKQGGSSCALPWFPGTLCCLQRAFALHWLLPLPPPLPTPPLRLQARLLVRDPALQPLERLHFADVRDVPRSAVLAPLACLHSLTSLRFSQRDGFQLPGPLTALSRLAHLHAGVRYRDDPLRVGADLGSLRSLRALWLQHAAFDAPSVLAALPELRTLALVGAAEAYPAVLAAMAASTQLRALHLEAHAWVVEEVPTGTWQALAELGAGCLTRLELPYTRLRELPGGAYLGRLEVGCGLLLMLCLLDPCCHTAHDPGALAAEPLCQG